MNGEGARIIYKSRYIKASRNKRGDTAKYASYIGTREGCVLLADDQRGSPASASQIRMIDELIRNIPSAQRLMSHYEYTRDPALGRASDFIGDALDNYGYEIEGLDGYAQYMGTRPLSNKARNTGLFSDGNDPVDIEAVKEELRNYQGNVWIPVISLRPEDSVGRGYDNPVKWHDLIERHLDDFAREYRIPRERLKWIGAYHNAINSEGYVHNHVHLMLWSTNPKDGYQSRLTGNHIRQALAKDIFSEELNELYKVKTETREEIKIRCQETIQTILNDFEKNPVEKNFLIQEEMALLAEKLKKVKGRKVYGYLPAEYKQIVDGIVNSLVTADPRLQELLEAWAESKDRQVKIYSNGRYELPSLSEIPDFRPIKNIIIHEALAMNKTSRKQETVVSNVMKKPDAADKVLQKFMHLCRKKSSKPSDGGQAYLTQEDYEQLRKIGLAK